MLKAPFKSLGTRGCCPIGKPSTGRCVDETADRYTMRDWYSPPIANWCAKDPRNEPIGALSAL